MKKVLVLSLLFLSACSNIDPKKVEAEYSQLSCDELKDAYRAALYKKVQAFNARMKSNDVNIAVGAITGVINGVGQTQSFDESESESEMDLRMASIRKVMKNKDCRCEGCNK